MIIIQNDNCIFYDCDDTLVMWESKHIKEDDLTGKRNSILIADPFYNGPNMYSSFHRPVHELVPHTKHIQHLKDSKTKNKNTIVVWSAGGWEWAEAVVKALELETYVDAVMSKPVSYVDDLSCKDFMGIRIYKEFKLD